MWSFWTVSSIVVIGGLFFNWCSNKFKSRTRWSEFQHTIDANVTDYNVRTYAVVTGATGGLGYEWVRQLALGNRFHLILVGRDSDKLRLLDRRIRTEWNKQITVLSFVMNGNWATAGDIRDGWQSSKMADFPVSLLINNAGTMSFCHFQSNSHEDTENRETQVNVNVLWTTHFTHLLLPQMRKCPSKARVIVNVSSMAAHLPAAPCLAVYAATKRHICSWSETLAVELEPHRVRVVCVCPGEIQCKHPSSMSKFDASAFQSAAVSDDKVVRAVLSHLGSSGHFIPNLKHRVLCFILSHILPSRLFNYAAMKNARARISLR